MKNFRWYIILSVSLIAVSLFSYLLQITIFHKEEDTFFYMLQDFSFVPINVLIVTFIIDKLLQKKEKENLIRKLNMIIGVFFNEIGLSLLSLLLNNNDHGSYKSRLIIASSWNDKEFQQSLKYFKSIDYVFTIDPVFFTTLKTFLNKKRDIILQLMANPNLLEHDTFTDMLLAVFHLADELSHREHVEKLPASDLEHIKGDITRAYKRLITEWLLYMHHLKKYYPYLFSVAMRLNPFDPETNIVVSK